MNSISFGGSNYGLQVGMNFGQIQMPAFVPNPRQPGIPRSPQFTVPFQRDKNFIENQKILDQVDRNLSILGSRVALAGVGGVGKSHLALECSYRIRDKSPETLIFWIHASSAARFNQCYHEIADNFDIPRRNDLDTNIFHVVHEWLGTRGENWIIVLDDLQDDYDLPQLAPLGGLEGIPGDENRTPSKRLQSFLPRSLNGSVLMTTRNMTMAQEAATDGGFITIRPMEEPLAMALLQRQLDEGSNEDEVRLLVQKLFHHPLAIVLGGCYIHYRAPQLSVSGLCKELDARQSIGHTYSTLNALHGTLKIVFDHIRREKSTAFDLLSLMSFFDPYEVPESLLRNTQAHKELDQYNESSHMEEIFDFDIACLSALSLIHIRQDTRSMAMHVLVQQSLRQWLERDGQTNRWVENSIQHLRRELPKSQRESQTEWRILFPHVIAIIDQRPSPAQRESLLEWATIVHGGARYAWTIGEIADMKRMALAAVEVRRELLGSDDLETIDAWIVLTFAYLLLGQWDEAECSAEQQVQRCSHILGVKHPNTLTATGQLALAKWYQGRWREAELSSLKLLDIARDTFGAEHPDTLIIMSNLAATYDNQGRWDEAEQLNSQIHKIRCRILGAEHPDTLTSMNNLAVTYENQGQLGKAELLDSQVIEIRRRVLGTEHPDTLMSMNNLASVYHAQGQFTQAEKIYTRVLEVYKRLRGYPHRDTLAGMDNLSKVYQSQGRGAEASLLGAKVLEGRRKVLGFNHPDTLKGMIDLAAMHSSQGLWDDAEAIQKQAIEVQRATLGFEHPDVLLSMDSLASIYRNQGRLEEAEQIYRQVIENRQSHLGNDHPSTTNSLGQLALVLFDQGNLEEAEFAQKQSIQKQEELFGPEHPAVLMGMNTLALIYKGQRRLSEAEGIQRRVVECRKKTLGVEHSHTLDSMEILAILLFELYQWDEAEALARKVIQTRARILREHDPDATKATALLKRILELKVAKGISDDQEDNSDISDFGSVVSSLSFAGSDSSATSFNNSTFMSAVEVFTTSLLGIESFRKSCKFALSNRGMAKARIQRNLGRVLRLFASHLAREKDFADHSHIIKFLRGASFRIASLTLQHLSNMESIGLEESKFKDLEEESSRAKVLYYLRSREDTENRTSFEQFVTRPSEPGAPKKSGDGDQVYSGSDFDSSTNPSSDAFEGQTIVNELQGLEDILFKTNAFHIMEREFQDFVFPSLRSILCKWIVKKRRTGGLTRNQLRDLEVVISELQHVPPEKISMSLDEDSSVINCIKGKWETFTAETWDWWPLRPYMRPLGKGEIRLHWECVCGRARWVNVPFSFAQKVKSASMTLSPTDASQGILSSQGHNPSQSHLNELPAQGQGSTHNSIPCDQQPGSPQQQQQSGSGDKPSFHVFLIVTHTSFSGTSKRLAQTSVSSMNDELFFSWVRSMYYTHRGFFPTWLGVYRYSHCAFFKFERFLQAAYAPLNPEFPGPQETSYYYSPKPISPDPPLSPHEFNHWFLHHGWYNSFARKISMRLRKTTSYNLRGFENVVVSEKLPKRDSHLEERDSSREVFWGLYIVEKRSTTMLVIYSVIFLVPSFYFLFAWLFQWSHYGDLQNASAPLSVSIGLLGTFWGIIALKSPRFDGETSI